MKRYVLLLMTMFAAWSCTGDYEELNFHPTKPNPDRNMTVPEQAGTLLPAMLYKMHNAQENQNQMIEQMVGNQYGGYMVTTNNWQGTNFGTFNPSRDWVQYPFDKTFVDFYSNYYKILKITKGKGYVFSLVNIIRVGVMHRLADTYGPIPYSQMGGISFSVPYDDLKELYHAMIADLDKSIETLTLFSAENKGRKVPIAEYDLVYKGDFEKWVKFANSLKLRLAVRIAGVDTEYARQVIAQAIAGGAIESNDDNAFLPTSDNPYTKAASDWQDLAINASLSTYMSSYADPRLPAYMTPTIVGGVYRGVLMGIANIDKATYGSANNYSKPAFKRDSPLLVFCAAETWFLKSEAALQGWIDGGEALAKTCYETGIAVSMAQHHVEIGDYLSGNIPPGHYVNHQRRNITQTFSYVTVAWDHLADPNSTKLEKIIVQKWIANYPLGFEAWADFRRTGYPNMLMASSNLSSESSIGSIDNYPTRMVRRLPYPASEYSGNGQHVQDAVTNLLGGPDNGATDLWWAKKDR